MVVHVCTSLLKSARCRWSWLHLLLLWVSTFSNQLGHPYDLHVMFHMHPSAADTSHGTELAMYNNCKQRICVLSRDKAQSASWRDHKVFLYFRFVWHIHTKRKIPSPSYHILINGYVLSRVVQVIKLCLEMVIHPSYSKKWIITNLSSWNLVFIVVKMKKLHDQEEFISCHGFFKERSLQHFVFAQVF